MEERRILGELAEERRMGWKQGQSRAFLLSALCVTEKGLIPSLMKFGMGGDTGQGA